MVNIRELRIGNWVYNKYHGQNIKITPFDFFTHRHDPDGYQYIVQGYSITTGRDLEPIPLTAEILEKNGFTIYSQEYTSEIVYSLPGYLFYLETYTSEIDPHFHAGCSIVTTRRFGSDRTWMPTMCHIHSVHQLQNILIDLGIDKEIIL